MKQNLFYSGIALVSLVLACSGAASDDPSDPGDGSLGEATEAVIAHDRSAAGEGEFFGVILRQGRCG